VFKETVILSLRTGNRRRQLLAAFDSVRYLHYTVDSGAG